MARTEEGPERLSTIARIRNRFRYGLATQEILDRLYATIGLCIGPYYLVSETMHPEIASDIAGAADDYEVRYLTEADIGLISATRSKPIELTRYRFGTGCKAIGLFVDGDLAAYTWFRVDIVPTPNWAGELFRLQSDEAYLFDAYVVPAFRGRRLVTVARYRAYQELARVGRTQLYSLTLAFNASSHRFKKKLIARNTELRLQLGLKQWKVIDIRLRAYDAQVRSCPWLTLSHRQKLTQPEMS